MGRRQPRVKLIDFNTQGAVIVDGPAGANIVVPLDTVTSALNSGIARYDLKLTASNTDKPRLIRDG